MASMLHKPRNGGCTVCGATRDLDGTWRNPGSGEVVPDDCDAARDIIDPPRLARVVLDGSKLYHQESHDGYSWKVTKVEPVIVTDGRPSFYVRHRLYQEMSGSGHRAPDLPWQYSCPFSTYAEAKAYLDKIRPNWQEGEVVKKCEHCSQYAPVKED